MKVLVVDDNAIIRLGLCQLLERLEEVTVVAEASDGAEALERAASFCPDVVLLDVRMPVMDGIEALPRLASSASVIMLTNDSAEETIAQALELGASGYLVHGSLGLAQVQGALATCRDGGLVLGPEAAGVLVAGPRPAQRANPLENLLTAREAEILEAAAQGLSNTEIAAAQFLSPRTVKNYLNTAYGKIGVHNRAEAVIAWREASAPSETGRSRGQ